MPTTTELTHLVVYPARDDEPERLTRDPVTPDQPTYGKVVIVKRTTWTRRASAPKTGRGGVGNVLEEWSKDEPVATLDAEDAVLLIRNLTGVLARSLTATPEER